MNAKHCLISFTCSLFLLTTPVSSKEFSSTHDATALIELFTSEGCSSCPPADKWLRGLKFDPQLFKTFIPLSFHVDYWDRLGWTDRFASNQYSRRQYQHQKEGSISQVYTPAIVVSNQEWRSWRLNSEFHWPEKPKKVGVLKAEFNQDMQQLMVSFTPELIMNDNELSINVAILGMDLYSEVKLGENRGRKLEHDFVVLTHHQQQVTLTNSKTQQWQIAMPKTPDKGQKKSVLVVWLSDANSQHIIQATGGYL